MLPIAGAVAKATQAAKSELYIYDFIDDWGVTASNIAPQIRAAKGQLDIRIHSDGGYVSDGVAIFNAIFDRRETVTAYIDGNAMSVAALIPRAAGRVVIAPNARMMLHTAAMGGCGYLKPAQLDQIKEQLLNSNEQILSSYARIGGVNIEAIRAILEDGEDHYLTPQQALELGLVDEIADAEVDPEALMASFVTIARGATRMKKTLIDGVAAVADPPKQQPTAAASPPTPQQPTAESPRPDPVAAERSRIAGIMAVAAPFQTAPSIVAMRDNAIMDGTTPDTLSTQILAELGRTAQPIAGGHATASGDDQRDKERNAASQYLLARAGILKGEVRAAAMQGNPFRGDTLLDLARTFSGAKAMRGRDAMEVFAQSIASNTSDFPVILMDTMRKSLDIGFALQPDRWRSVARIGAVSDFRPHHRIRTGSIGNLVRVRQNGEYETLPIPDGEKATISVDTYGALVNWPRQLMVNDDMSALQMIVDRGRAAARTLETAFWAYFASNPNLEDGLPMWDAVRNNVGTSGAPSVALIDEGRMGMAQQQSISSTPNKIDYLDITPEIAVAALSLGSTFRVLNAQEFDDEANRRQNRPNVVRGLFGTIIDTPRLSGNGWWMMANPNTGYGAFEVAFLNGNESPFLDQQESFHVDGITVKVRHDWGIAALDHRGIWYNAGAGS
jgi:ATP-dependent protease ClpP protease subunit